MRALYERTLKELKGNKWVITERWLCFMPAEEKNWTHLCGDRFYTNCGLVFSLTATSPTGTLKSHYAKIGSWIYEGRGSGLFDKLDKITDEQFKKLRSRAKRCANAHGIDFEAEACFISSGSVHGFYLPNNREGERVIAFINGKAYLFSNELLDEILDY